MGFNRVTWTPGHERKPIGASHFRQLARLRRQREAREREAAAAYALKGSLVSLAALIGSEVKDSDGRSVGRLELEDRRARRSDTPTMASMWPRRPVALNQNGYASDGHDRALTSDLSLVRYVRTVGDSRSPDTVPRTHPLGSACVDRIPVVVSFSGQRGRWREARGLLPPQSNYGL